MGFQRRPRGPKNNDCGYCLLYFPMSSLNGECVDFFHHVMKELTFHNIVKVQSSCCLCPSAVAQKSLTHDVPTCL